MTRGCRMHASFCRFRTLLSFHAGPDFPSVLWSWTHRFSYEMSSTLQNIAKQTRLLYPRSETPARYLSRGLESRPLDCDAAKRLLDLRAPRVQRVQLPSTVGGTANIVCQAREAGTTPTYIQHETLDPVPVNESNTDPAACLEGNRRDIRWDKTQDHCY